MMAQASYIYTYMSNIVLGLAYIYAVMKKIMSRLFNKKNFNFIYGPHYHK